MPIRTHSLTPEHCIGSLSNRLSQALRSPHSGTRALLEIGGLVAYDMLIYDMDNAEMTDRYPPSLSEALFEAHHVLGKSFFEMIEKGAMEDEGEMLGYLNEVLGKLQNLYEAVSEDTILDRYKQAGMDYDRLFGINQD